MMSLDRLRQMASAAMEGRTRRERIALSAMAATVVLALWIQLIWTAAHERQRLTQLVGDLQVRNETMRQAKASLLGTKSGGGALKAATAEQALRLVGDGLRAGGLPGFAVVPDAQGQIRLSGTGNFDAWLASVAKLHGEHGIHVVRASVEPAGQAGSVKIEAVFATAGGG